VMGLGDCLDRPLNEFDVYIAAFVIFRHSTEASHPPSSLSSPLGASDLSSDPT